MTGAEVLAQMARLLDKAQASGLARIRFELGTESEAARVAEMHKRGFPEAGLHFHGAPIDVTSFEPWRVALLGELTDSDACPDLDGRRFPAEPLTGWHAAAESVAKLMEAEALKRFHGISPNNRPNQYSTDSGKLEVVCSPEGATSWQLSRPTPAGKPPLSGPIPRTQARDLIAARMESRLS